MLAALPRTLTFRLPYWLYKIRTGRKDIIQHEFAFGKETFYRGRGGARERYQGASTEADKSCSQKSKGAEQKKAPGKSKAPARKKAALKKKAPAKKGGKKKSKHEDYFEASSSDDDDDDSFLFRR